MEEIDNIEVEEMMDDSDKEGKDLFNLDILDDVRKDPKKIIKTENSRQNYKLGQMIQKDLAPNEEMDNKIHPGFVSSYSFGEKEFERLSFILNRLDLVAEKVNTYRKEDFVYFPEYYSTIKNLYINIKFLFDTNNRKRIQEALSYIRVAVIDYTTKKIINFTAVMMLEEVHNLIINLKNFHNLGISYEKKKGDSEKYHEAFFKKKAR